MKPSRSLSLLAGVLLCLSVPLSPAWGVNVNTTQETFVLSNEGTNGLVTQLINAGYGPYNTYDALVAIQQNTDPSVAGIITPAFLAALQDCPASSQIFTNRLSSYPAGSTLAISTDGTVQIKNDISGASLSSAGFSTLVAMIEGVGSANFTHSSNTQTPMTSWSVSTGIVTTTYNAFAVAWAASVATFSMTVDTSPTGLSITVDSKGYTAPANFNWSSGSTHTIATSSPQAGVTGTQYAFAKWSDGGAQSHTVTASAAASYIATFVTQYQLTMTAGTGGGVSPPSGYYNAGSTVSISATPNSGYVFTSWTGAGSGACSSTANPCTITVNGPIQEAAGFAQSAVVAAQTFILSDEASGHLVTELVAAGYGNVNLYQALLAIQQNTDPSVAGIITPAFLATLQSLPAASLIFTKQLKNYPGSTVAISTDGTVQTVNILGAAYYNQPGTTTLSTNIEGVGPALFTYSTTAQPLTSFQQGATTYNVFAIAWAGPPAPPPTLVSLSPPVSAGASQSLTVTYNAPGGYQSLNVVNVLINNFLDGRQACYLAYSVPSNTLYIVPDNGDGAKLTGKAMDGTGTIANSQCTVTFSGSSASGTGNTFTLILNLSFTAPFGGNKVVYAAARDLAQGNSGWQTMGVHGVPPLPSTFPNPVGLNPSSGSTLAPTITFTYQDQSTAANLQTVWALINTAIDGRAACYVAYYRPGNELYLYPDNGDGTQATNIVLTGTNTIGNSQCTISAQGANVQTTGNTLTVTLPIAFKTAFAGFQGVWLAAQTMGAAQTSAWQALGAWVVPGQ